jgi:menaquinone-dependent protoporphyrinogen oxidase
MTAPSVLVAYATKNGGTADVARWIGETLAGEDLDVEVRPAAMVDDVHSYTAVVLGSGVYAGRWLREAVRFAHHQRKALLGVPVWLFSSGPLDASAAERDILPVRNAVRLAEGLDALEHVTFGGRLVEGARGVTARMILRKGKGGDFRDREQIRAWALGIAKEVAAQPQGV